jgi:anti-sigma B factor antagonist
MPESAGPDVIGLRSFAVAVNPDPDGGVRVRVAGELDLVTAPVLAQVLEQELTGGEPRRILLDVDAVDFMDSSGIATIVSARQVAARVGHDLTVRCGARHIRRVFEASGLLKALDLQ